MTTLNSRTSPHLSAVIAQNHSQPHLSYYISRTNGTFVPLIPADELPFNIRLQGIPRILNSDQVFGLQHVATLPYTGCTFRIEEDRVLPRSSSQPPATMHNRSHSSTDIQHDRQSDVSAFQAFVDRDIVRPQVFDPPRSVSVHETATNWRKAPTSDPQAVIDAIVGTKSGAEAAAQMGYTPKSQRTLPPSGNVPDQEKKQYCTHWIRYGECDYTQQGCLYKHEMPDKATLFKIGFRNTPRWWLEKTQSVTLGGVRATVGPITKSSVWLKSGRAESPDRDSSDSEVSDSESVEAASTSAGQGFKREKTDVCATQTASPTTSQQGNLESKERKQSITDDLIKFEPLVPTASYSITLGSPSSSSSESVHINEQPPAASRATSGTGIETKRLKNKVFVPAGEDQQLHITEAKSKAVRQRTLLAANKNKEVVLQRERRFQRFEEIRRTEDLMASKHAPSSLEVSPNRSAKKAYPLRRSDPSYKSSSSARDGKENA